MFKNFFTCFISGFLLCCVLVDPVVATFAWLYYQKTIVKEEVNRQITEGIDRDELVLLKFSKKDAQIMLRWEHSKEFEYDHQMYDVVKKMTLGDTVYCWCLTDHEETKLNRRLEELSEQTFGKGPKIREKHEVLISFFKLLYFSESFDWKGSVFETFDGQFRLSLNLYSSVTIQPPTPPPQWG